MPPSNLDRHRVCHFTQCTFRRPPLWPHQNLRIKTSISWQRAEGNLKQLIAKAGRAWITALMRTSRPAWERSFSFQHFNLDQTRSLMKAKLATFPLPTKEGRPRYFSYCLISETPSKLMMFSWVTEGVALLKNRAVLSLLSFWPEAASKSARMAWMWLHSYIEALQKRRLSSAKNRWVSRGPFLHREIPLISPS